MSKKKAKIETPDTKRAKAKAELKAHLDRAGRMVEMRRENGVTDTPAETPKGMSGLDAAAILLKDAPAEGVAVTQLVEMARNRGLWTPAGKTPAATLHAAISREIKAKGSASRFQKVGRGRFALQAVSK
mgnify:CR=1 FL=1